MLECTLVLQRALSHVLGCSEEIVNDWTTVVDREPYKGFRQRDAPCEATAPFAASPRLAARFPNLCDLLASARCTRVHLKEGPTLLFSWRGPNSELSAWLASEKCTPNDCLVCHDHRFLLSEFGSILERYNEPEESWLLNHGGAWTANSARFDASFINDSDFLFEEIGGIPVDTHEFYPVAREANGNCVLCSRVSGRIIVFAPYGQYGEMEPLDGCPGDTLYTFEQAPDFALWVESIAGQWMQAIAARE